jgi:hypothetical protein
MGRCRARGGDHAQRPRLDRRIRGVREHPLAAAGHANGAARELVGGQLYHVRQVAGGRDALPGTTRVIRWRPRGAFELPFEGPVWRFVEERLPTALRRGDSTAAAARRWQSSAYLLETVPTALFILAKHADDPEEAIIRAVNDTFDNDTNRRDRRRRGGRALWRSGTAETVAQEPARANNRGGRRPCV